MSGSEHLVSSVVKMIGSSGAAKAVVVQSGPHHEGHKVSIRIVSLVWLFSLLRCFWVGSIPAWSFHPSKNFVNYVIP